MAKPVPAQRPRTTSKAAPRRSFAEHPLPKIKSWMVACIFFLMTLVFHSSILFGDKFLWEDFVEQEFPFRTLAATSLAHGILPHWDPYIFGGMPFMADIQAAFWYPTNLLQTLFVSNGHLSAGVMEWFILLHYAVAGFGMFYFVRKILELDDFSSLFAGITYAFSGYIVAQAMHQMIVYHIALFPWIAFFFLRGLGSWKHALVAGVLLGTMYLGGHPQSTLYFTFALGIIAVYSLVKMMRSETERKLDWITVLRAAIPVVIGLGIFAIQLMPSNELAVLSRREVMTFDKSVEGSLSFGNLMTLVLPHLFGLTDAARDSQVPYWNGAYYLSWETAIYIGILPLFFALVAMLVRGQKFMALFAGLALFALLFSLGDHFVLYRIFFSLPFFSKLRTPARMMMVFSFAMSVLAGMGLSQALRSSMREKRTVIYAIAGLIALIWLLPMIGAVTARSFLSSAPPEANASISWSAGQAAFPVLAMLVIAVLWTMGKLRSSGLAGSVVAVTVIELFSYGMHLNASPENPAEAFEAQPQLVQQIKTDQSREVSRARTRSAGGMLLKRNDGAYDRIQLMEGYNPLVLQRVSPEMKNLEGQADLMNIKWSIFMKGNQPDFGMRETYMPRAMMYYKVDVRPDSLAQLVLKTDSSYDYHTTLLLEEKPSLAIGQIDPAAKATITSYEQNEIKLNVKTATNGMLWLSEVYYPAWKAYVDEKPVKIYRAFTTLRAIEMPAGTHNVVLRYESDAFQTGSMITIATLLLTLGGLGFVLFRGKRSEEKQVVVDA
jgi:hypothetical protein